MGKAGTERNPRGGAGGEAAARLAAPPTDANSGRLAELSEVVTSIQCHKDFRNIDASNNRTGLWNYPIVLSVLEKVE